MKSRKFTKKELEKRQIEKIKRLKRKSRKYSIAEGSFATIKASLGDAYIVPFALAANAGSFIISFFSSIPAILGPISQIFGSHLIKKNNRKKILSKSILLESLIWIFFIILGILYTQNILTESIPLLILIFFTIYSILLNIGMPAWFSWIGDIVNEKRRGKFLAWRTYIHGFISIIFAITAAFLLNIFAQHNQKIIGFLILFSGAFLARIISRKFLLKQYESELDLKEGEEYSFWAFLLQLKTTNFGKFTLFRALIGLAASIAAPFFAVYMLNSLKFDYVIFMTITLSATLFSILIVRAWGKFADKYGNYEILKITGILIPLYPLLWLFSNNPLFLILGPSLISGIAWSGFNLAVGNFIFDSIPPEKRGQMVSYHNLIHGIGIFLGASIGGLLIKILTISFMDIFLFLFLISSISRFLVSIIMIPLFKEIKETKKFNSKKAIKHLVLHPPTIHLHTNIYNILPLKKFTHRPTNPAKK